MDLGLRDAAVLVTGGSSGIGRATAVGFAREGARVAITYNSRQDAAEEVAGEIKAAGGEAFVVPMELREPESVEEAVGAVVAAWGGLDVLVGNAVNWGSGSFHDRTPFGPHWRCTSSICGMSTAPATSTLPSAITWQSVASTGAAVITGEQIRTRRFARPIHFAIRCESASP